MLAEGRIGQGDIQRVVVLEQRGVPVVQHQCLQGAVQVVGLGKAVPRGRLENHTVFDVSVDAAARHTEIKETNR